MVVKALDEILYVRPEYLEEHQVVCIAVDHFYVALGGTHTKEGYVAHEMDLSDNSPLKIDSDDD